MKKKRDKLKTKINKNSYLFKVSSTMAFRQSRHEAKALAWDRERAKIQSSECTTHRMHKSAKVQSSKNDEHQCDPNLQKWNMKHIKKVKIQKCKY